MSESDLKINSKVRKILVENNLDTASLHVSTSSGVVSIRGEITKFPARKMSERDIAKCLVILETTALRTKGVKRVSFSLRNWEKKKGKWTGRKT